MAGAPDDGSSWVDSAGLLSWKEEGSGSGRRWRIREAKESLEARVLRSRVVGGMMLGSWESFGGVDVGGGVGGRGRKKGILRGDDASGESVVLGDAVSLDVAFGGVAFMVVLLG